MNAVANQTQVKVSKVAHLKGHLDAIYDFALDEANEMIYSAGADGYIVQWGLESEEGILVLKGNEAFYSVFLDQESQVLYAGTKSGNIYSVDLIESKLIEINKSQAGGVFLLSSYSSELISGGENGVLCWGESKIKLSQKSLRCYERIEDRHFIGSSDGCIYELSSEKEIKYRMKGHENSVFALCSIPNTNTLLSTGRDAHIKLWDTKSYSPLLSIPAHNYQAKSLSFLNGLVLSSSMDKTIKLWDTELNLLKVIDLNRNQSHSNCINKVRWFTDDLFVSCSDDRSLMIWQIELN